MGASGAGRFVAMVVGVLAARPAPAGVGSATLRVTATVVARAEIPLPRAEAPSIAAEAGAARIPVLFVDGAPPALVILERRAEPAAAVAMAERAPRS